jgi:hypothetical protein
MEQVGLKLNDLNTASRALAGAGIQQQQLAFGGRPQQ